MTELASARPAVIRPILRWSIAGFGIFYLASCGGSKDGTTGPTPGPGPVAVASVTLAPSTLSMLVGESGQLTATMRDAAGNVLTGRAVTWASARSNVATVSGGEVLGVATGTTTITATADAKIGSAEVSVISLPIVSFSSVVTGGAHTCALTSAGAAYCWGRGESGQLGGPPPASRCLPDSGPFPCSLRPQAVGGGIIFARLTGGGAHTCGLTGDGSAYCWGLNLAGQLGDNSTIRRDVPVPVSGGLKFATIDAGTEHTCGLSSGGVVYCWGRNDRGQLGDGTTSSRSVPTEVRGGFSFKSITAGGFTFGHSCALTDGGAAYCWGDNERGQLGIGSSDVASHPQPSQVTSGLTFVELSAGLGRHSCARTAAGAAYCWGENAFGALGNGSSVGSAAPVAVSGGLTFVQLAAGGFIGHTCALANSGAAYCWGENEVGAVGDGTTIDRLMPVGVAASLVWTSLDAGFRHTCGRAGDGALYCWGSGRAGQLGTNSTSQSNSPSKVVGQP